MFCGACGAAASSEDRFCRRCGGSLHEATPRTDPPPPGPRIVAAALRPSGRRDRVSAVLRLASIAGLAMSVLGVWTLLAGPADTAEPSSTEAPTPPPVTPVAETTASVACSNTELGFELDYPAELLTLRAPASAACRFFHDAPFEAPPDGELPPTKIRIYLAEEPYRSLDRGLSNTDGLRRSELEIGGRAAFVVEMRDVQVDGGERGTVYAYVIDMDGEAIVADAFEPYSEHFRATTRVLDEMISSLRWIEQVAT